MVRCVLTDRYVAIPPCRRKRWPDLARLAKEIFFSLLRYWSRSRLGVAAFFLNGDLPMLCGELGMSITGLLCWQRSKIDVTALGMSITGLLCRQRAKIDVTALGMSITGLLCWLRAKIDVTTLGMSINLCDWSSDANARCASWSF